ncbi:MAG: hypothetical protein PF961_01370 [Planctomycetota bacterium]|nr:hypothetical protein [Planctomycetota bacterium]
MSPLIDPKSDLTQPDQLLAKLIEGLNPDDHAEMANLIQQTEVAAIAADALNGRHLTYVALALKMLHAIAVLDYSPHRWRTSSEMLQRLMSVLAADTTPARATPVQG